MNFRFAIFWVLLIIQTPLLFAQSALFDTARAMNDQQIWDALINIDAKGSTIFGQCRVAEVNSCAGCACSHYFRAAIPGTLGSMGWPKNPISGDGTGCLTGCWSGYTPAMCSADMKANAKAMLLDAIAKNACGTYFPPQNSYTATIYDGSRYEFVTPGSFCAKGKYVCGLTGIGASVAEQKQFTVLPTNICRAAYITAQKMKTAKLKLITCEELTTRVQTNVSIHKAARLAGQLNQGFTLFNLNGMQKLLDATEKQYAEMPMKDVALFYVAVQKNIANLPAVLKKRAENIPNAELETAEARIKQMSQDMIQPNSLDFPQAYTRLKEKGGI